MRYYDFVESPLGSILLVASDEALHGAHFVDEKYYPGIATSWKRCATAAPIRAAAEQLRQYFAGERQQFELALEPEGTAFQRLVWSGLLSVPYARTIDYGELARRVGNPRAARAVGAANGRNPIPIIIPCHRVIGADGSLTGYGGGLGRKRALLELEANARTEFQLLPQEAPAALTKQRDPSGAYRVR
jgi:methylated-DNA-[protein]-cysteine S-methyltransferase